MSLTRTAVWFLGQFSRSTGPVQNIRHMTRSFCTVDRYRLPVMCTCQAIWDKQQIRSYAKGKDKKKQHSKTGGGSSVHLDDSELQGLVDMTKYRTELNTAVEDFKKDLVHKMALRTTIGSYEILQVNTKDGSFPLNQIALISQKSPTILVISLQKNVAYMPDVLKALKTMNVNPQQEGQSTVIVTMAKVSREHREEMAKKTKVMLTATKDRLNKIYSKNAKHIPADDWEFKKLADNQLLSEKKKAFDTCEQLMKTKTAELLA